MYFYWKNIKFFSKKEIDFENDILVAQLITVPAAPGMIESINNPFYYKALENATYSIIDSGLFALLCKLQGIKVHKYSGYRLIHDMLAYLKQKPLKLFVVSPRPRESDNIRQLLLSETKCTDSDLGFYNAPMYPVNANIEDPELAQQIKIFQPDLVILCVAGGKQEILGHYLKKKISEETTIICTGAAISFFTGTQAKIPSLVDRLYLGWLARIIFSPKIFLPRYINALKYIILFYKHKSTITII